MNHILSILEKKLRWQELHSTTILTLLTVFHTFNLIFSRLPYSRVRVVFLLRSHDSSAVFVIRHGNTAHYAVVYYFGKKVVRVETISFYRITFTIALSLVHFTTVYLLVYFSFFYWKSRTTQRITLKFGGGEKVSFRNFRSQFK